MLTLKTLATAVILTVAAPTIALQATAATAAEQSIAQTFVKKSKSIKGSYTLVERGEKTFVVFSDDFKAKRGPDLKVFLSPTALRAANGKNAVRGSVQLGALKTTRGVQEYEIPAGIDIANFESVLVHCEAYSVLWGGAAI